MKTSISLGPTTFGITAFDEFCSARSVAAIASAAERLGFDAVYTTEHPIPRPDTPGGGHHAPDPLVTLAAAATVTSRLRLQTHLVVLPYRNPFLLAKEVATLDFLSGGRVILGAGAGYVEAEFAALGVDFDERNELTDEALEVLRAVWTGEPVTFTGRHFAAEGTSALPRPIQRPHPPIWIGGNSRRAIRRAVDSGQGWAPFPNPGGTGRKGRTAALFSFADLGRRIDYLREYAAQVGRAEPLEIAFTPLFTASQRAEDATVGEIVETASELAEVGVTYLVADARGNTTAEFLAAMEHYAAAVLPETARL